MANGNRLCTELGTVLDELIAEGAFPGATLMVSVGGRIVASVARGRLRAESGAAPVHIDTRYDLASVTKTFVSVAVVQLLEQGALALDDPAGRHLPELPPDKAVITIRQLLAHTGGLPVGQELHDLHHEPGPLRRALLEIPLEFPPGTRVLYSSLGYIFLGWIIERLTGTALDRHLARAIFEPCRLQRTSFEPVGCQQPDVAATERRGDGVVIQGWVHDEKAQILGGITGHAGLFAPVADVLDFGEAVRCGDRLGLGDGWRLLFEDLTGGLAPSRSAAFVIDDPVFSTFDAPVFSHTGFTGTSLCLVPTRRLVVSVLTNRVHPTRENDRIAGARTRIHRAVQELLATH